MAPTATLIDKTIPCSSDALACQTKRERNEGRRARLEASSMEAQDELRGRGEKVLKLFGVRILGGEGEGMGEEEEEEEEMEEDMMRKSSSMGNLVSCTATASAANRVLVDHGYHSDGGLLPSPSGLTKKSHERKRGIPWTEEEHRTFLIGLQTLGKGDWRGISRKFVTTRTPTQVASHAQKYFIRQSNPGKKKRRCSLFDVVVNDKVLVTNEVQDSHLSLDNNSVSFSNNWLIGSTSIAGGGTSSDFQNVTNQSGMTNLPNPSPTVVVDIPTQMSPHLIELSLSYPTVQIQSSSIIPTGATDLELRIAPPLPHDLSKVPAQSAAGAIRVV
ncbi:transcription factor SRM1-like [Zingiber officinale]|uniref:Uncharacterized protein n=1 Tax=Zingiber officinale TaxID=94328 RepID=A0A8J5LBI0_ZINOF|nr:transcription factor SRM1-like [Zingiber officinale]KAG6512144.1 hypothetical protein ZIOFF_030239 [Zingiber officinale]